MGVPRVVGPDGRRLLRSRRRAVHSFEGTLIPMYIIIGVCGPAGSMRSSFFSLTLAGSLLMLKS
jgi:hypothetical protein